jgi:hypothetical protein
MIVPYNTIIHYPLRQITLMMEAASTSEMMVNLYQITQNNIPEDSHHLNV